MKSASDIYKQATRLIENIAVIAYQKAEEKDNWNENPNFVARLENVNSILNRYINNIAKACGQSYPLSNVNFNKPFPRNIYADTHQ